MILDDNSISIGDIQKQNCLAFKQSPCTCNFFAKPAFPTFFKLLAFPQFLRYDGEIDMIREGLLRGFTLKITGVIVRSRITQLLYIGVRKTPLGYGSENAWLRK